MKSLDKVKFLRRACEELIVQRNAALTDAASWRDKFYHADTAHNLALTANNAILMPYVERMEMQLKLDTSAKNFAVYKDKQHKGRELTRRHYTGVIASLTMPGAEDMPNVWD